MKKRNIALSCLALLPISASLALLPGFYVGGQLGWSNVYYTPSTINAKTADFTTSGGGGRAYLGYQFNKLLSTELGYSKLYNASISNATIGTKTALSGSAQYSTIDLVGKGTVALSDSGFDIFAKAGGAYVMTQMASNITNAGGPNSVNKFAFTFGAGFDYSICPQVVTDLTYTRVVKTNEVPNADLTSIGLAYYFG